MTLRETLKKSKSKHIEVVCKVGKYYHEFHQKAELDKLADLEVIDTSVEERKVFTLSLSTYALSKPKMVKYTRLVVDTEQAKKVLGKERF